MNIVHPFPRGFVIFRGQSEPALPDGWRTVPLSASGWSFGHDPVESPELVPVGDGDGWVLTHGLCLYAGPDDRELSPARRLAEAAAAGEPAFLDQLDLLGGRHVVLLGNAEGFSLYQDATGMRSVYFSPEASLVGSHVHLLNGLVPHRRRTPAQGLRGFIRAWDRTPYAGIHGMLPNHRLSVPRFMVERFFPRAVNANSHRSLEDRIAKFRRLWERQWASLSQHGFDTVMSVTGGNDSRTSLALLADHADSFKTFTYTAPPEVESEWADSVRLDEKIVRDITACISLDHRFLVTPPGRQLDDPELQALVSRNTVGRHGTWLLPYYLEHLAGESVIHVRGNTYGVYKAPWGARADNNTIASVQRLYMALTRQDQGHEAQESRNKAFQEGFRRWGYNGPLYGYHRFELLYWEIRLGRWACEIYNETDVAFASFDPTNVRAMLEIALSFTIPEKKSSLFQAELVNAAYPLLNFPGKNTPENLYEQTRGAVLEATALHANETAMILDSSMDISHDGTSLETISTEDHELYIPSSKFSVRTVSSRTFASAPSAGMLTFTIDTDYAKLEARGTWHYQVTVDGVPGARWDGAVRRRPVHVTVENLNPGTRVAVQAVALRDRTGMASWENATRARITDGVFTAQEAAGPVTVSTDVPGSGLESTPEVLRCHVDRLHELTSAHFSGDLPRRVDVITEFCVIPMLVVPREGATASVTLCNGPVDLESSGGQPVFQRVSWWDRISHHQIHVCDPATVGDSAVPVAWGQYSPEYWAIPDMSRAVIAISSVLGCGHGTERIYFGSSAGGFMALALAVRDAHSHAVLNNAQFDWNTWHSSAVERLRTGRLRSMSLDTLRSREPERVDVLAGLARAENPPTITYLVNDAVAFERETALVQFETFLSENPRLAGSLSCERYHDHTAGSAPLGPVETISLLADSPH